MSLESQILQLKAKHKAIDGAFQDFQKIIQSTHDVVSLAFKEQREYHGEVEYRLKKLEHLAEQQNKRTDKIEELLIQIVNNLTSK